MSALARYFLHEGYRVAGYDRTATPLTHALEAEGAAIHYEDDPELIPNEMRSADNTLVVYTPQYQPTTRSGHGCAQGATR